MRRSEAFSVLGFRFSVWHRVLLNPKLSLLLTTDKRSPTTDSSLTIELVLRENG